MVGAVGIFCLFVFNSAVLAGQNGSAAPSQEELLPVIEGFDRLNGMASPSAGGCSDSGDFAAGDKVDCRVPFENRCKRLQANPDNDPGVQALADITEAIALTLAEAKIKDTAELLANRLTSKGIPFNMVPDSKRAEINEKILLMWFKGSSAAGHVVVDALKPLIVKNCDPQRKGSATSKLKLLRKQRDQIEAIWSRTAWVKEPLGLYRDIEFWCNDSAIVPLPAECGKSALRRLRNDAIGAFVGRQDESQGLPEAIKRRFIEVLKHVRPPLSAPASKRSSIYAYESKQYFQACDDTNTEYGYAMFKVLEELRHDVALSKPVIRYLEKKYFSDANYRKISLMTEEAKAAVAKLFDAQIVPLGCLSNDQATKLRQELAKIEVWREKTILDSAFTTKRDLPWEVLLPEILPLTTPIVRSSFRDSGLRPFLNSGGRFFGFRVLGAMITPELVNVDPANYNYLNKSPDTIREFLAHELGHKLDIQHNEISGTPLRTCYARLLDCFSKKYGIRENQQDEALADWIDAHVMGERFAAIKAPAVREDKLDQLVRDMCLMDNESELDDENQTHPLGFIRMNWIFGRQPEIRKALGCPSVSHCTLKGEQAGEAK